MAPEHVAVANRGFVSLYSGLDLRGWKIVDNERAHWHVNDWVLAFDGKTDSGSSLLVTSESLASPNYVVDLRPLDGFVDLPIGDGVLETPIVISPENAVLKPLFEKNAWIRLETSVKEHKLIVTANGQTMAEQLS